MPTARQIKAAQRRVRKELERDARKADRARLRQLREHIRAAKKHAAVRRREVVVLCRRGRARAREAAKALRAEARAALHAAIDAERAKSRSLCEARKNQARTKNSDSLQRAAAAYAAEAQHQKTVARWSKPARARVPARVALQESDSDVIANIPPDLVPVWKVVRAKIKGTPRRSRAEAFIEWAAEHTGEVMRILDQQFAKDVDRMVAEERQLRRDVGRKSTYCKSCDGGLSKRAKQFHQAEAVPF
jgi:hypothetical protein